MLLLKRCETVFHSPYFSPLYRYHDDDADGPGDPNDCRVDDDNADYGKKCDGDKFSA